MLGKYKIEIKWAFIFVAMTLTWMFIEKMAGLHSSNIEKHPIYTNLIMIPALIIYYLALTDKRNNFYGGTMTYKQGFISGIIISVILTVLAPLTQCITSLVISPDYFANVTKYSVEKGMMSQTDAEQYFNLSNYIIQSTIATPIFGVINSAIMAFFAKRANA